MDWTADDKMYLLDIYNNEQISDDFELETALKKIRRLMALGDDILGQGILGIVYGHELCDLANYVAEYENKKYPDLPTTELFCTCKAKHRMGTREWH